MRKRFELSEIYSNTIMDTENCVNNGSHCRMYDIEEVVDLLNELVTKCHSLEKEKEQLKIQLLNCEQKNNGGFQVWEVPPIPKGKRISFTTYDNGDGV